MAVDTRFLSHDAEAGILEIFHYDDVAGEITIETIQNCEAIVEAAKAEYNMHDESSGIGRRENFFKVGTVPAVLVQEWKRQGIDIYTDEGREWMMKNFINNRDYMAFRTRPGTF